MLCHDPSKILRPYCDPLYPAIPAPLSLNLAKESQYIHPRITRLATNTHRYTYNYCLSIGVETEYLSAASGISRRHRGIMPDQNDKVASDKGSIRSSEYSGTSKSVMKAEKELMIDPKKAELAISSGKRTQEDRKLRKEAREKAKETKDGK